MSLTRILLSATARMQWIASVIVYPNASITRVMAGCFGFLTLTQLGEVPAR
jgi:hypothetical protein